MAKEVTAQSKGALDMQFFGKTLIPQELEVMNAVKSGTIAIGSPAGAAATVFPEMGALLVPYLVKDYASAYAMFNGRIGDKLDKEIQDKYKLKVLCYFDYGFRHFWTSKKPIVEPKDLRGMKIRVQQAKVFGDTINGLGGNAVPMALGRGHHRRQAGRDRRRRSADRQHEGAEDLRGVEICLDDLSQLRPDQRGDESRRLERPVGRSAEADHGPVARGADRRSARRPSRSTISPRPSRSSSRSA